MSTLNDTLQKLCDVAANPAAQLNAMVAQGKKAIGCFPVYSPAELVIAAGMTPFAVWGAEMEISSAKKYFPSFYCGIAQTCLEMGLNGKLDKLSGAMSCAAISLGLAQSALDATVKYTKERIQFGKPIAANQGVQWMIADMATRVDCARMLVYRAAALKDAGEKFSKESAMAKLYCAETAMFVTHHAVQLHGGMGYTKSYPVERLFREAKLTEIFEGTSEIQRIVIAKHVLG